MIQLALDYRDTVDLLQHKLINYIRLNQPLNNNIRYKARFVINSAQGILFNFVEFSDAYKAKYISPDFEGYCKKFIEFLKPLLVDFLQEIRYGGHTFKVTIRFGGDKFEKIFTVLNKSPEHGGWE